jgi:hypothetical protein
MHMNWIVRARRRSRRVMTVATRSSVIALTALALAGSTVLAAGTIPAQGGTITASGGWSTATGQPDTCDPSEWLFVINGLSSNASTISPQGTLTYQAYPKTISVVFDNALSVDVPLTLVEVTVNPPASTAKYAITADTMNSQYTLDGATATFGASTDGQPMAYNNFVLSHGPCASSPNTPPSGPPGPPPPGATPELDSLVLFGFGAMSLGSYALTQLRGRRRLN